MTRAQVEKLLADHSLPAAAGPYEIVETNISVLILGRLFVYKMKKPVHFTFLDFSSLERREFYCHEELKLNRRLAPEIYLDVVPISSYEDKLIMNSRLGEIIDYAVVMRRMPSGRQMDLLLQDNKVNKVQIRELAEMIAAFHKGADIIQNRMSEESLWLDFEDLANSFQWIIENISIDQKHTLSTSMDWVKTFVFDLKEVIADRSKNNFVREVHGDLHAKNIFLLEEPLIFDCLEFSEAFRQIDVLNDIAFLILDLIYFGHKDLAIYFLQCYLDKYPAINKIEDYQLFLFYCLYRANIKIKVYALKAGEEADPTNLILSIKRYIRMYQYFLKLLKNSKLQKSLPDNLLPD